MTRSVALHLARRWGEAYVVSAVFGGSKCGIKGQESLPAPE